MTLKPHALALALALSSPLWAGLSVTSSLGAGVFSFASKDEQDTPNYYGPSLGFAAGYATGQKLDLSVFARYSMGTRGAAQLPPDATLLSYGGQLALHLGERVYWSLRGGVGSYELRNPDPKASGELDGAWSGPAYGMGLGTIWITSKETLWQLFLDYQYMDLKAESGSSATGTERTLDQLQLVLAYHFSNFTNNLIEGTLFEALFF